MEGGDWWGGVIVINQALAQLLWPGENAVGRVLFLNDGRDDVPVEIVGVVRNFYRTSGDNNFKPTVYIAQPGRYIPNYQLLVKLRPGASLKDFQANVQRSLSGLAAVPTEFEVKPLGDHVKDALASRRLTLQLLTCFAVLGTVVSGLGLYATAALMAASRNHETGIRMAMGAQFWDILRLALWRGIRAIIFGLPFGLFLAWVLSKILSRFLVQINVYDPLAWIISCAVFMVIVTAAALIPARRAARVNPLDALRDE
jgi:ABC-type antimicrobial peptide transport system permease subunit